MLIYKKQQNQIWNKTNLPESLPDIIVISNFNIPCSKKLSALKITVTKLTWTLGGWSHPEQHKLLPEK